MELIDRKKAIREIDEMIKDLDSWKDYTRLEMVNYLGCMIMDIPATDGLVHAKWINEKGKLKCSVCDCYAKWSSDEGGWWSMDDSKYCPNCGAKMDVQEE